MTPLACLQKLCEQGAISILSSHLNADLPLDSNREVLYMLFVIIRGPPGQQLSYNGAEKMEATKG